MSHGFARSQGTVNVTVTGGVAIAGSGASTVTSGTLQFANSNGVTFGLNGSTMTASVAPPVANYVQSLNGSSGQMSIAASPGGNITVAGGGSTILLSAGGGAGAGIAGIAGSGASTVTSGTLQFANSNSVSFGLNGSTMTASVSFPAQTSLSFSNTNNVTFGIAGSTLTASVHAVQTGISGIAASGASTVTNGTVQFANSNGVSFGLNGSTITASHNGITSQSVQTQGSVLINGSSGSIVFSNSNNVTFGVNASTITASASFAGAAGIGGVAGSGASTVTSGTLIFSNLNFVSFGLNGSTMTASIPVAVSQIILTGNSSGTNSIAGQQIQIAGGNNITVSGNGPDTFTISAANSGTVPRGIVANGGVTATSGTVFFSDSNNISWGINGNTLTASAKVIGGISASTSIQTTGTIIFSASNGVSFGLNNGTMTASVSPGGGGFTLNGTTGSATIVGSGLNSVSNNASTIVVSARSESLNEIQDPAADRNFVMGSFGLQFRWNNSVSTNATRDGAFEIDAQGNMSGDLVHIHQHVGAPSPLDLLHLEAEHTNATLLRLNGAGSVLCEISGSNTCMPFKVLNTQATVMCESLNVDRVAGMRAINAAAGASTLSSGTLVFSNSNNVSFGLNGSTLTASAAAGTGNIAAIQASGPGQITSGTAQWINTNGMSWSIDTAAGQMKGNYAAPRGIADTANTVTNGTLVFSNSNNVSFGLNGSTMTASATFAGGAGIAGIAGSGASTVTAGTVQFANLNGVSFGLNGSTMTASISKEIAGIGNSAGTYLTSGSVVFYDSNGVSFGVDTLNNRITASVAQAIRAIGGSAGNSMTSGTVQFYDSNGGSWSADTLNGRMVFNWPGPRGVAASGASTLTNGTLQFANSNGVTFGMNGSTITCSVVAGAAAGIGAIAGSAASSVTSGTLQFQNSNSVSFGLNGSTMTASIPINSLVYQNSNGVSFGTATAGSTTSVTASIAAVSAISGIAGSAASTVTNGTLVFSNLNGVSFGLNGSTMTASIAHGTRSLWQNFDVGQVTTFPWLQGSLSFQRVFFDAPITATRAEYLLHISGAASQGLTLSNYIGLFSLVNSTSANSVSSTSGTFLYNSTTGGVSSYTNFSGTRFRNITMAGWNITPGEYLLAFCLSTATGQTAPSGITLYGRSALSVLGIPGANGDFTYCLGSGVAGQRSMSADLSAGASPNVTQSGSAALGQAFVRLLA